MAGPVEHYKIVIIGKTNFSGTEDRVPNLVRPMLEQGRLSSLGKCDADRGAPANFALNPRGAPVKIDNRLY
jgi:hypothetical protein